MLKGGSVEDVDGFEWERVRGRDCRVARCVCYPGYSNRL